LIGPGRAQAMLLDPQPIIGENTPDPPE